METQNLPKGEHYNLRWTNYLHNLSQVVLEHHLNEKLVDVTLVCEGQYIRAHKLVLSACSNFFQDLFKVNSTIIQLSGSIIHPFIVMNGIRFNHLKHIVDFMYQGEIKVLDSDLEGVLALGDNLQVKGLCSVKLKQKVMVNNEVKNVEPVSLLPTSSKQPLEVESKINIDNIRMVTPPSKTQSKVLISNNSIPSAENLSLNKPQEEPKNYSKVSLDALAENRSKTHCVNNTKKESKIVKIPTIIAHPVKFDEDMEEPTFKKVKVNPPPLIIRRSDMIKTKPTTSDNIQKSKSPVLRDEKKVHKDISVRVIVDSEIGSQDKKSEIPRPPNAFMIFATEWRKKLVVEHPEENSKDISTRLGNLWKTLSPETKETYYLAAQTALREHELKYPHSIPKSHLHKKKKTTITSLKKSGNFGSSNDSVNSHGDDDDLEIIESSGIVESNSQDSKSTLLT